MILGSEFYLDVLKGCLGFNDSWTREFQLVILRFQLETRNL